MSEPKEKNTKRMPPQRKGGDKRGRYPQGPPPEGKDQFPWKKATRTLLFWVLLILISVSVFQYYSRSKQDALTITYTRFIRELEGSNIQKVKLIEKDVKGEFKNLVTEQDKGGSKSYKKFKLHIPFDDPELLKRLEEKGVEIDAEAASTNWSGILLTSLPWILILVFWLFLFRQMQGGSKGLFSFGKSRAKLLTGDRPKVTFTDVAGADEAKEELTEIIEFLKDPSKFQKLGG
ncbi:MAG: hypothetical protein AMJ90_08825, partial [candidate division Zixibacteria bacterium SM23_73_2]